MIRSKKLIAVPLLLMFGMFSVFGCTPQQTQTAKDVSVKAATYIAWAELLVSIASTQFPDNQKVQTAMFAVVESLSTIKTLFALMEAGIEKNMDRIVDAASDLIKKVFALKAAIEAAKKTHQ
jgi:uncharacterized protein YecA (UPF0149 family)